MMKDNPETTVHVRQPRSLHRALEDGELLAQSEIFKTPSCAKLGPFEIDHKSAA